MVECIICKQKQSVWSDYDRKMGLFGLCFDCLSVHMPEEAELFQECGQCNQIFKPQAVWQKICVACWKYNKYKINSQECTLCL
jgi:hypothetical protein